MSALLCFGLARCWGRPLVERLVRPPALARADGLFTRYGTGAVLLGRLIPLTAFDLLSYAAGLTRMRPGAFALATAVGMAPATFLMAAAGDPRMGIPALLFGSAGLALLAGGALAARRLPGAWRAGRTAAAPEALTRGGPGPPQERP